MIYGEELKLDWVFVFPGPQPLALAPNLYLPALTPNLYLPVVAPNLCLLGLASNLYLTALALNMCLPALAPNWCLAALGPNLHLLAPASNLLFTSSGPVPDFTTTTTATCTITTTTITTTTTTATRDIITRDAFAAVRSTLNGSEKIFDEKVKFCFSKFVSVMANVSLNREAAAVKEIGGWLFLK